MNLSIRITLPPRYRNYSKPKQAAQFKTDGLIFVKTVKREQDYRFAVPVFGLRTLEIMAEQNIRADCRSKLEERSLAVLKAGDIIMVEKDKILAAAKAKIQIIGF